jgi:hypothetical protein
MSNKKELGMPENKTIIGKGWIRKQDWDGFLTSGVYDAFPEIFSSKGRKDDWGDEDWPPVKVDFEIKQSNKK